MCNNIYIQEKMLEQEQQNRIRAIEHHRDVVLVTKRHRSIRHLVKCCGTFLIVLGGRLEQVERREIPVRV